MSTAPDTNAFAARLAGHAFFNLFAPETARQLQAMAQPVPCADGEVLFDEGAVPDCLYLVLEGAVDIFKAPAGEARQVLARIEAGDYFGEYGVLDGFARSAGAAARGPALLARLPRDPFLEVLRSVPGHSILGLTLHLVRNIRETNEKYVRDVVRKTKTSAMGEMLNTILHDYRNPFAVIVLSVDMIRRAHPDDETVKTFGEMIAEQMDRMVDMTDDLLDYSRGVVQLKLAPTPVSAILGRFERLNREFLLASHKVELVVGTTDTPINVDANKILRIIQNLVNNAAEMFGDKGGRIEVTARDAGNEVEISVRDNGPGIPEPVRARLFEPFATHGKAKGIGLGLPIVKSLTESHGGRVRVETETGKGTTFYLTFPACRPE